MPLLSHPNPAEVALSIRASALVFEDPASRRLLERINVIAPSELNTLIVGETGTGKELVARHIHDLSQRREGPFLAVNCGALPETLIESELFGHERGAFTGANAERKGWFEAASGGTLFLDEIGDLPLPMQVKLLRVLQEQEVVRVGSYRPIPIDVRFVAATNVRLEEAVSSGRFREDLYYRLNVAVLNLPPLRERPGDILPLARHFVAFYGHRLQLGTMTLAEAAQQSLLSHAWPGNIRELENVLHHALLVARNGVVQVQDLHFSARRPVASAVGANPEGAKAGKPPGEQLGELLARMCADEIPNLYGMVERELLSAAYQAANNNQLATARLLGISRHVARARLLEHGILRKQEKSGSLTDPRLSEALIPVRSSFFDRIDPPLENATVPRAETGSDWWGF